MNKRIFTLMAAAMLLGAPMSNLAFAAAPVYDTEAVAISAKNLANGVKFALKTSTGYAQVTAVDGTNFVTKGREVSNIEDASVFEIRNFSNKTFELWVNGKQFVTNGKNVAADADGVKNKVFYAVKGGSAAGKTDFTAIHTVVLGGTGDAVYSATAETKKVTLDAEALNKNMSGKGFSFQFPRAKSTPDKNPFANQLVAVNAEDVLSALEIATSADGFLFAVADEAGLKLLKEDGVTTDNAKAATFVVVDPQANFGITGFDAAKGEGYDFTTVKGDKLATSNKKKDGKIAYVNGIYTVTEDDAFGAAGQYTIVMSSLKVKQGNNENAAVSTGVNVGAYSLTAGGIKTYVTTFTGRSYAKAQTTGNTWAKASDILKTTGAAIYNIYFTGTQPADKEEELNKSLYGKYLVSNYATTGNNQFTNAAVAPAKMSVKAPSAQWAVISMGEDGTVTFQNVETNETFTAGLYKTDKAGIYQSYASITDQVSGLDAEQIKLVPVTATEGFLSLTDAQLKQKAQLIFNGEDNLIVSEVYMSYDGKNDKFIPLSDANQSQYWTLVKAESVKNQFDYVYLKDNQVTTKEDADMLSIQAYYLTTKNAQKKVEGLYKNGTDYSLQEVDDNIAAKLSRVVFKKNANGTYAAIVLADQLDAEKAADNYKEVVKADAKKLYVNDGFSETNVGNTKAQYANVTISLNNMGESLEAVSRHATLNSDEGAVSFKENKNGILEGIIAAEGLTFWLDTANSDAEMPTFYISKGNTDTTVTTVNRNYLYYAQDSLWYWNENEAKYKANEDYALEGTYSGKITATTVEDLTADPKAIFRPAVMTTIDTLKTTVAGKEVIVAKEAKEDVCLGGVESFKYYITKAGAGYVISPMSDVNKYLYNLNGKLGFTKNATKALVVTLGAGDPTANESVADAVSSVKVIAGNGTVTVQGAAGKKVTITNVLGKVITTTVLTSDNATFNAPAGIVVVAVEGEDAVKAAVK